jgi:hypothetical protein
MREEQAAGPPATASFGVPQIMGCPFVDVLGVSSCRERAGASRAQPQQGRYAREFRGPPLLPGSTSWRSEALGTSPAVLLSSEDRPDVLCEDVERA